MLKDDARVTVQKNVLCKNSAFFKAACSGSWQEAKDGVIKLQDYCETEFLTYLHWLYTGTVNVEDDLESLTTVARTLEENEEVWRARLYLCSRCYVLGNFTRDTRFCNAVIDKLLELFKEYKAVPGPTYTKQSWSAIPANSGLARLLIDFAAYRGKYHVLANDIPHQAMPFALDSAVRGGPSHTEPSCLYEEAAFLCQLLTRVSLYRQIQKVQMLGRLPSRLRRSSGADSP